MTFDIEPLFARYAPAAVERLRYLYPRLAFTLSQDVLTVEGVGPSDDPVRVRRDWSYQLYREKVFHDGLPMREAMYSALFG
jgi:hypothetical protein